MRIPADSAAAGVAAENLRVGPTTTAERDDRGSFIVGNATTNELEQSGFADASVLEIRKGRTGENGQAGGAAVSLFQNDLVREAREAHRLRFAGPQADLIELGKLHHCGFCDAGAKQVGNVFSGLEWLFALARETHDGDAVVVGKAALLGLDELRGFVVGDVHAFECLNGGKTDA